MILSQQKVSKFARKWKLSFSCLDMLSVDTDLLSIESDNQIL